MTIGPAPGCGGQAPTVSDPTPRPTVSDLAARPAADDPAPRPAAGDLAARPVAAPPGGLLDGLLTTRAIRRYTAEPVPPEALRDMLFAATRGPSGSNRQPYRFVVCTDGPAAAEAKRLIGDSARRFWTAKRQEDGYDRGSGADPTSPKARTARALQRYVDDFEKVPVLVLACLVPHRAPSVTDGASVYPACQNLLLAARALGYGGVMTIFHAAVEAELRRVLGIPEEVVMAATVTIGRPVGGHGPVRRRPMGELVYGDRWGEAPPWAVDPPGTRHTAAGPPRPDGPEDRR